MKSQCILLKREREREREKEVYEGSNRRHLFSSILLSYLLTVVESSSHKEFFRLVGPQHRMRRTRKATSHSHCLLPCSSVMCMREREEEEKEERKVRRCYVVKCEHKILRTVNTHVT